jgi:hypothetical protein
MPEAADQLRYSRSLLGAREPFLEQMLIHRRTGLLLADEDSFTRSAETPLEHAYLMTFPRRTGAQSNKVDPRFSPDLLSS